MSFICKVCGELKEDNKVSYNEVCIYCDATLIDDTLNGGQLF
jgi:hypothetical protein